MGNREKTVLSGTLRKEIQSLEELLLDNYISAGNKLPKNLEKITNIEDIRQWDIEAEKILKAYDWAISIAESREKKIDEKILKIIDDLHKLLSNNE